jgi:site-specific DNA-methyltransferase (adenine-specific)
MAKPGRSAAMSDYGGDSGGASRFFKTFMYCPKPSRAEREAGCESLPLRSAGEVTDREDGSDGLNSPRAGAGRTSGARNTHPTLKSIQLMRYLCRLVTPPGGVVLDPFMGSGTTGIAALLEGFRFYGIEMEPDYFEIAQARIEHRHGEVTADTRKDEAPECKPLMREQLTLWP